MKINAVLFDLDGVVVDTEPLYTEYWNMEGVKYGYGEGLGYKVKAWTVPNLIESFFPNISEESKNKILLDAKNFDKTIDVPLMPHVKSFIEILFEKNYKIGLVTSSTLLKARRALEDNALMKYFSCIVSSEDVLRGKPDPQCYLLGAERLGAIPEECAVMEDSVSGIKAAFAAGMRVIGIAGTLSEKDLHSLNLAHAIISGFENLNAALATLK